MNLNDILPIIVPAFLLQLFIEAYYIRHCWENPRLSQKQKAVYIITIVLFNIVAAAAYLFLTRKKDAPLYSSQDDEDVDTHIRQGIFVVLVITYEIFSFRLITRGSGLEQYSPVIALLAACFVLMIANGLLVKKRQKVLYYLLPSVEIALIMAVAAIDTTQSAEFLVMAVVASIINGYPLKPAKVYSLISFLIYFVMSIVKTLVRFGTIPDNEFVGYIYGNLLVFMLVFLAFYTLKKQLIANARLGSALITLKEQSLKLEEMGAVAERNRIAGEIHDTVGHTLTTAIISIKAGEQLMDADPSAALKKFHLAGEQIERGLNDIRSSVKMIQSGGEKAFLPELNRLLDEIRENSDLKLTDVVDLRSELLPIQQSVLLRAVKECATNSLKHGHSTEADLLIQEFKGTIHLTFSDNGTGAQHVNFGFGLSSMQQRVKSIGGMLSVSSAPGEGFTVQITIPTGGEFHD